VNILKILFVQRKDNNQGRETGSLTATNSSRAPVEAFSAGSWGCYCDCVHSCFTIQFCFAHHFGTSVDSPLESSNLQDRPRTYPTAIEEKRSRENYRSKKKVKHYIKKKATFLFVFAV
jgi:hypothetical protein